MSFSITNKFQFIFSSNVFSLSLQLPDPSIPQPVGLKSPLLSELPLLILCVGDNKTIAEFSFCWITQVVSAPWNRFFQRLNHLLGCFLESVSGCPCVSVVFGRQGALAPLWGMVLVGQWLQHCWISLEIKMDRLIICQPCHFFNCNFYLPFGHFAERGGWKTFSCGNFLAD